MLKQFLTLIRGHATDTAETVLDRQAVTLLRQQIRECADAVNSAKRAVALAIAQNDQEVQQTARLSARIADLEGRAVSALEQEKHDLAREAAETIAMLEAERETSLEAQRCFETEIARLKRIVRASEARLRDLERGQRIAVATETTARLRDTAADSGQSSLRDAEATLARLRARQKQMEVTEAAMAEMERSGDPAALAEKLAAAGCGAPPKHSAEEILKRLAARVPPKV
jgi:phage shock protein A